MGERCRAAGGWGDLPKDTKVLRQLTLGDLVRRYRDSVSIHKAGYERCIVFNAFLKHPICCKSLAELRTEDFADTGTTAETVSPRP